eukprot:577300-Pyramimonas_sp.AAC.1
MWCSLDGVIYVVQDLLCKLCGASEMVNTRWWKIGCALYVVQSMSFDLLVQYRLCIVCDTLNVVQSMWCHLCGAGWVVQSMRCNVCGA